MARFAEECVAAVGPLLLKLELELGPDTSDLGIRVGLNSGPVTAGVLRGDRARFQLFGDTVNTAARMESTSSRNRIQISKHTAEMLTASGKGYWVKKRDEVVMAKGKGELEVSVRQIPPIKCCDFCLESLFPPHKYHVNTPCRFLV